MALMFTFLMRWSGLFGSLSLFLAVNSFFRSWYSEEVLREATLLGPGGSILGPEPVKSALGQGHGVVVRKGSDSSEIPVTALWALPP